MSLTIDEQFIFDKNHFKHGSQLTPEDLNSSIDQTNKMTYPFLSFVDRLSNLTAKNDFEIPEGWKDNNINQAILDNNKLSFNNVETEFDCFAYKALYNFANTNLTDVKTADLDANNKNITIINGTESESVSLSTENIFNLNDENIIENIQVKNISGSNSNITIEELSTNVETLSVNNIIVSDTLNVETLSLSNKTLDISSWALVPTINSLSKNSSENYLDNLTIASNKYLLTPYLDIVSGDSNAKSITIENMAFAITNFSEATSIDLVNANSFYIVNNNNVGILQFNKAITIDEIDLSGSNNATLKSDTVQINRSTIGTNGPLNLIGIPKIKKITLNPVSDKISVNGFNLQYDNINSSKFLIYNKTISTEEGTSDEYKNIISNDDLNGFKIYCNNLAVNSKSKITVEKNCDLAITVENVTVLEGEGINYETPDTYRYKVYYRVNSSAALNEARYSIPSLFSSYLNIELKEQENLNTAQPVSILFYLDLPINSSSATEIKNFLSTYKGQRFFTNGIINFVYSVNYGGNNHYYTDGYNFNFVTIGENTFTISFNGIRSSSGTNGVVTVLNSQSVTLKWNYSSEKTEITKI